jgi:hypothetical protein
MSKKFSRILQGARYNAELTAYIEYLTGKSTRQPNIGNGKARPNLTTLYVHPYAFSASATVLLQQSASTTAWTTYEGDLGGRTLTAVPSGSEGIKIRGAKAARIIVITGRTGEKVVKTSHVTAAKYLKYAGNSTSVPFGRSGSTDTVDAAFTAIKALIAPSGSTNKVYLQPEKVA